MQHQSLTIIFLLSFFSASAMELISNNNFSGLEMISDDFLPIVCSQLDRPARDSLRCTSKRYLKLIPSQESLNKNYKESCDKKDGLQITYWKSLGGVFPYQEFAHAVKNERKLFHGRFLAVRLLATEKVSVWDAYCLNIRQAVETATVDETIPVIKWLLDTRRPVTHQGEFLSGFHYSNNLIKEYPGAQKFVDLFKKYQQEEEREKRERERRLQESTASGAYLGQGRGPWHARGDYC